MSFDLECIARTQHDWLAVTTRLMIILLHTPHRVGVFSFLFFFCGRHGSAMSVDMIMFYWFCSVLFLTACLEQLFEKRCFGLLAAFACGDYGIRMTMCLACFYSGFD